MPPLTGRQRLVATLARILRVDPATLAAVTVRIDDSPGWLAHTAAPNERDAGEIQQQYTDALTAWRKHPMAKRIVDITTDYCLGDGLRPTAPGQLGNWIERWWNHPKNRMEQRLPELSDELTRAGDLFLTLHTNPDDGLSYVRPIPKDRILRIDTLPNDYETEIAFHETIDAAGEPRTWLAPDHPDAPTAPAIMIHYAVNRVVGALIGESDLGTILPWLLRYSRMLEDRVRLNWATKLFMWLVTVPTNLVQAKREQYNTPPEAGTIIVKDEQETWEPVAPSLNAFDARFDLLDVRRMIDAGSGLPPHWRGEATDVNLATATAMERSASRHLERRQRYLRWLLQDLTFHAYSRAYAAGFARPVPRREDIQIQAPDLNRQDNRELATAAAQMAGALTHLDQLLAHPPELRHRTLRLLFSFAGETLDDKALQLIDDELAALPPPQDTHQEDTHQEDNHGQPRA